MKNLKCEVLWSFVDCLRIKGHRKRESTRSDNETMPVMLINEAIRNVTKGWGDCHSNGLAVRAENLRYYIAEGLFRNENKIIFRQNKQNIETEKMFELYFSHSFSTNKNFLHIFSDLVSL